jgi:quercetin dioxygenase-like cupin family protein/uncharacterized damage-inducible protein DinB
MNGRPAALLLAAGLLAAAPVAAQDPLAVAPANHKVTLDNERTRTYEITIKPGVEIPMHSHPEHVVYVLAGGKLLSTDAAGKATETTYSAGQTVLAPAGAHTIKNIGRTTLRAVVTELKQGAPVGNLTKAEKAELLDLYRSTTAELLELAASTPDELWLTKPAPDRWSVSETIEHIAITEKFLFGALQGALASPVDPNWALVESGFATDQILGLMQDRSKKFNAPEPAQPKGGMSRADVLALYGGTRMVSVETLKRLDGDVKKHVGKMPTGPMTAHQILAFIGGHNLRHNAQIRETLAQLNATATK